MISLEDIYINKLQNMQRLEIIKMGMYVSFQKYFTHKFRANFQIQ